MTTLERLLAAFDGDSVPEKNIALRGAFDEITRLRERNNDLAMENQSYVEKIDALMVTFELQNREIQRLRAEIERLEAKQ